MRAGVVGAGIMGRLLAFELLQTNWSVTLFDENAPEDHANCSMAAAGLLTPVTELEKNDALIFHLGMPALTQHWPRILKQLTKPVYFQTHGSLVVAHPRDQSELVRFMRQIQRKLPDFAAADYGQMTAVATLEPELAKFPTGYYCPREGCLDTVGALHSLYNQLKNQIVWRSHTRVVKVAAGEIVTTQDKHTFDMVFDCRGLGAKADFAKLRGVRGELIAVRAPAVNLTRCVRLLHPRYSLYVVPRPQAVYLLGASEIEAEDNSEISVKTLLELLSAAYYLHSGFAEARLLKTIIQLRPTLQDQLPKIKYSSGLIAINGLYRHGFLIAPTLATDVLHYLNRGISAVHFATIWEQTL